MLLALDDDSVARAVVRVTAAASRTLGAVPTVLRVFELGMFTMPETIPALDNGEELMLAAVHNQDYRDYLLRRVSQLAGGSVDWRTELDIGSDVQCIIHHARAIGAEIIVMGREHHGALRRALVGDTVRQVMVSGVAPVLAVTRSLEGLPRQVVVGIDFTPSSIRAARWALRLLDRNGALDLVYVEPTDAPADGKPDHHSAERTASGVIGGTTQVPRSLDAKLEERFKALIRDLHPSPTVRVEVVRRSGRAADQLCARAQEVGADLIALGSHRQTLLERIRLGSVSAAVLHDARCSVLVAPPEPM